MYDGEYGADGVGCNTVCVKSDLIGLSHLSPIKESTKNDRDMLIVLQLFTSKSK